jgi:hypothetical protein
VGTPRINGTWRSATVRSNSGDDGGAHWADRATLATAWALARRSRELGLMLLLAMRPAPRSPELEVDPRVALATGIREQLARRAD